MKTLGVIALVTAVSFGPAFGNEHRRVAGGAWMSVTGTVLSVDRRDRTIVLRYAPLETAAGGTVRCAVIAGRLFNRLRRGDRITGIAETDRHPWILGRVHLLRVSAGNDAVPGRARRLADRPAPLG